MGTYWELETENYIFFWGGILSNWAKAYFTLDNITYNCAEQHMMNMKANLFGDALASTAILACPDPKKQKALGRTVHGYDDAVWLNVARSLVYRGVYAKFAQNSDLKTILLSTDDKILVEASPLDKRWGIGLGTDSHVNLEDPTQWLGTNWLGQVLMKVRADLRAGIDSSTLSITWSNNPAKF